MGVIAADVVLRGAERDDDSRRRVRVEVRGVFPPFRWQVPSDECLRELERGAVEALPQIREQALGDDGLEHAADRRRDGPAAVEHGTLERRQAVDGVRIARELRGRVAFCQAPDERRLVPREQVWDEICALRQARAPLMHAVHTCRRVEGDAGQRLVFCCTAGHPYLAGSVRPRHNVLASRASMASWWR